MRIVELKILRADGGWRPFSFLKLVTDAGLNGWSEFIEGSWSPGLAGVIQALAPSVVGEDPRAYARLAARLHASMQMAAGGVGHQAIAAIENACVDLAARARGVPVHALFGGPVRQAIDLYWSHCGSFRARLPDYFERVLGLPRLGGVEDFRALGREARRRGYKAVKTNPVLFGPAGARLLNPGFGLEGMRFERTVDEPTLRAIGEQALALREGLGPDAALMLDVNFSFRPAALRRVARALEPARPYWLETDLHDPAALATARRLAGVPFASLESLHGRRAFLPYLQAGAVDFAIIDVPWNGIAEAVRIAALAETFEVDVAPHNFNGPLADLMSAHFCAAVGNVAIMEYEGDDVPWKSTLLTHTPRIEAGQFHVPDGPGWGAEPDEQALAAHPWRGPAA
ncbi:MAG: mandelate racemase/muconate lactonizing enzyme family protein [Steroidobacteraceae bacterium]